MPRRLGTRVALLLAGMMLPVVSMSAQSTIGTVRTEGAQIQGTVSINGGRAVLQNTVTVSAGATASDIALSRGGAVRVCAGSVVALSRSNATAAGTPLLIALQRGAVEIEDTALRADAVLTPDLRLEMSEGVPLDLRVRVNQAGDTCVENLGKNAPILHVTEQFSGAGYLVKSGQRVLFEHGSVREVVDRQNFGCGCPKPGGKDDFPEAVSAGMAQPEVPAIKPGDTHVQVSTGMDYNGQTQTASGPPNPDGSMPSTTAASAAVASPATAAKTQKQQGSNPFAAIGRFFHRLFGGGS